MEKKLNVGERLIILQILPKEGNFATLRLLRDLSAKIGLSAEELEEFEVKQEETKILWNTKGIEERPIELKTKEIELISKELKKMDKDRKLDFQHFSIFEKFVGDFENAND
jgi:hypothetical protein